MTDEPEGAYLLRIGDKNPQGYWLSKSEAKDLCKQLEAGLR